MIRNLCLTVLLSWLTTISNAQDNTAVMEYINTYKQLAIEEMQRTGVPASIKLAQGIHETEAGKSELVLKSNNHFGIKCKSNWVGDKVYHDDDASGECFRSYSDPADSYRDHSNFLKAGQRYAFLFQLDPADYKGWAYGLKKAGYATNIKYSQLLIRLIETYNLQQYSLIAMGKLPPTADLVASVQVKSAAPVMTSPQVYPAGIFQINNTKVLFVKGGTSLLLVANQHALTLARLLEFNDITPGEGDILAQDQLIFLQRKRKTGANLFHHVQQEESIYDIAQEEGIRYEMILDLNHLQQGMEPAAGEKIYLREKSPARPALAGQQPTMAQQAANSPAPMSAIAPPAAATTHIVRVKETLYSIGKKYGVTQEKIREWNKLNSSALKAGQELIIYTN
jgi:LysM repeat protein